MRKRADFWEKLKKVWNNKAAIVITVAAAAFMCGFTIFEFAALRMEWDVPILAKLTRGADSYIFEEYRNDEMCLEDSSENILLNEGKIPKEESRAESDGTKIKENTPDNPDAAEPPDGTNPDGVDTQTVQNEEAEFPYYIKINRKQNCITVYTMDENGEYTIPYKAMICSTGLYNGTPRGVYHLSTKYLWRELYGKVYGQYATRITGGVLFHSVPYRKKSKDSLCTDKYNKLGQQASMGCVRLTVADAKWIAENCPAGTTVEIYDDDDPGPLGKPEAVHIDSDCPNKGWDPTDPDEDNPWHQMSNDN